MPETLAMYWMLARFDGFSRTRCMSVGSMLSSPFRMRRMSFWKPSL